VRLERRPRDGLLGGMWSFPEREIAGPPDAERAALDMAADRRVEVVSPPVELPACAHKFTHLHATYVPRMLRVAPTRVSEDESVAWIDARRPAPVALPTAQKRVLESFLQAVG
jgi:adenine-specific DNA glycosylase